MSLRSSVTIAALAAVLVGAAACGKSKSSSEKTGGGSSAVPTGPSAPSGSSDPRSQAIIATSKDLRDRACACAEPICAVAVRKEHDVWLRGQIDEFAKLGEPPSTPAQQAEAAKVQHELFECFKRHGAEEIVPIPSEPPPIGAPPPTLPGVAPKPPASTTP